MTRMCFMIGFPSKYSRREVYPLQWIPFRRGKWNTGPSRHVLHYTKLLWTKQSFRGKRQRFATMRSHFPSAEARTHAQRS